MCDGLTAAEACKKKRFSLRFAISFLFGLAASEAELAALAAAQGTDRTDSRERDMESSGSRAESPLGSDGLPVRGLSPLRTQVVTRMSEDLMRQQIYLSMASVEVRQQRIAAYTVDGRICKHCFERNAVNSTNSAVKGADNAVISTSNAVKGTNNAVNSRSVWPQSVGCSPTAG